MRTISRKKFNLELGLQISQRNLEEVCLIGFISGGTAQRVRVQLRLFQCQDTGIC